MLRFFGRGSAFADIQNSAFFVDGERLVMIDCPMSSFHVLRREGPNAVAAAYQSSIRESSSTPAETGEDPDSTPDIRHLYVLVTHTHGDHVGGIPMLIHYAYYIWHIPLTVIAPSDEVREDLEFLINRLEGCGSDTYELITADDTMPWGLQVIPTSHTVELEGRCFGFRLVINGRTVVYTGDTNTLAPFLPYLEGVPGAQFYTEVAVFSTPVHLYIYATLDELKSLTAAGVEVFLMHLDDEEHILTAIEGTGIQPAPLYIEPH